MTSAHWGGKKQRVEVKLSPGAGQLKAAALDAPTEMA